MISRNQIKFIKSLNSKKNRNLCSSFVVESNKNILELLDSEYKILQLFATRDWIINHEIDNSIVVNEASKKELERMSNLKTASDVLAVVKIPNKVNAFRFSGINIVLDDIKDPGNLGTIIRTCDFFGVKTIFCSDKTVDVYNPKVVQSTMGSIFRVNVIYTDIYNLIKSAPDYVNLYCSTMNGENINSVNVKNDSLIIFGNESIGISKMIDDLIEKKITIKRKGYIESLNVAVSVAVILNRFCN